MSSNYKKSTTSNLSIVLSVVVFLTAVLAYYVNASPAITNIDINNNPKNIIQLELKGLVIANFKDPVLNGANENDKELKHELVYTVDNVGEESAYTKHTILITFKKDGEILDPNHMLIHNGTEEIKTKTYILFNGEEVDKIPPEAETDDTKKAKNIKYTFDSDLLESVKGKTKEDGNYKTYSYMMWFDACINEDYIGVTVDTEVVVEGMQFENDSDKKWTSRANISTVFAEDFTLITIPNEDPEQIINL